MASERLIRLLQIIDMIQSRPGINVQELAEVCEVSERTIYRDLEVLAQAGYPIANTGYGKGYRFTGRFALYPMDLTEEERMAFSALSVMLESWGKQMSPALRRAYEKVMAALTKEQKDTELYMERLEEAIQLGKPHYAPQVRNLFPDIFQAIVQQRTIEAVYHSQGRNVTRKRLIDPYHILPREHRLYIIGFCHEHLDFRIFRLSRFQDVKVLDQVYEKRPFDIRKYMEGTWSIERGNENIRFVVRFSPNVARYVLEEEMFLKPEFTEEPDGSVLMEVTVNNSNEFLRWLYMYNLDAEIIEPVEYREKMRERLQQWLSRYEREVQKP